MFKKSPLASAIVTATLLGTSFASQAAEVDMIIKAKVQGGPIEILGSDVSLKLSYDSDIGKTSIEEHPFPHKNIDLPASSSSMTLEINGNEYLLEHPMPIDHVQVEIHNDPNTEDYSDDVRIRSNEYFRLPGTGNLINNVQAEFMLQGLDGTNLPDSYQLYSNLYDPYTPATIRFNYNGMNVDAQVEHVYQQPIEGCDRQTTYSISAVDHEQKSISTLLTLSPRYQLFDGQQHIGDSGYSSGFEVTVAGHTYSSMKPNLNNNMESVHINLAQYDYFITGELADENGQPAGFVDLNFMKDPSTNSLPELLTSVQGGHMYVGLPNDQFNGQITNIEVVKSSCEVLPEVSSSPQNMTIPVFDPNYPAGPQEMAYVPSTGGAIYFNRAYKNETDKTQKIKRWAVIEMPNGQTFPHGGAGTKKVLAGEQLQELDVKFYIPKFWPDGEYKYTVYTLSHDKDLIPEKSSMTFQKGGEQF